jgi:predicted PhzF superfamily epimerase YddE/YHI9
MRIPYFHVDAFASRQFEGNPAGVCLLQNWLPDKLLRNIAMENNLSETAFLVPAPEGWNLRWFTPEVEVDLCGHATLAAAFVLFVCREHPESVVHFQSRSGPLCVRREGADLFVLDFPSWPGTAIEPPTELIEAFGSRPDEVYRARDYMAVFKTEEVVELLQPKMSSLLKLDCTGIIATAPGKTHDFVSRFFAPRVGVPEDPVTGSAHCTLAPYWARRLGKTKLRAAQLSRRRGELQCEVRGERVLLQGQALLHLRGEIELKPELC